MTTSDITPGQAHPPTSDTGSDSTKDKAKQAAGAAADEGKQLAGTAQDEARQVAADARQQARNLMDEARVQVDEQSRVQRDRLVSTLRTFGDDLQRMAEGQGAEQGIAKDLTNELATRVHEFSSTMDGRDPADLLEQVRSFARRKPGTFLLGALAAGVVAGRLTRGAKDSKTQSSDPETQFAPSDLAYSEPPGTATGDPLAGTGYPATPPVYPAGSESTVTGAAGVSGTTSGVHGDPLDPGAGATRPAVEPGPQGTPPAGDAWTDDPTGRGSA